MKYTNVKPPTSLLSMQRFYYEFVEEDLVLSEPLSRIRVVTRVSILKRLGNRY